MATVSPPQSDARPKLPTILELDKSEEPFAAQVSQCAIILGIQLDEEWKRCIQSIDGQVRPPELVSDPRPEWAVKWVLKKLQSAEPNPSSPNLQYRAWVLLWALIVRIPLANVAQLLRTHKFTSILQKTLRWLQNNVNHGDIPNNTADHTIWDISDSSSDTVECASNEQTARKRKQDGTEIFVSRSLLIPVLAVDTLYVAICAVVKGLEALIVDKEHLQGFAVEHMKSSLRCSLDEAASILGASLYLANHLLQSPKRKLRRKRRKSSLNKPRILLGNTVYRACIFPIIEFWHLSSDTFHKSSSKSRYGAFTTHCMLPSLQLLLACHDPATSDNPTDGLASLLERLITKHVILPAHASFLDQAWAKGFQDGQTPQSLSTTLVSTLESFRFPEITPDFHAIKIRNHLTISFLSLLFELAIGCYKDSEPQILKVENPWLGELFNQLGDCARTVLSPKYESQAQKYYARVLEWMLRKAVNHQIRLSTSTLGRALKKASGLFNKGRSENTVTDQENEMEDGDRTKGMSDKTENNQENGPHKGSLPSETSQKPEENQRNETSQRNEADGTQKKEDKSHVEWGLVNLCLLNDANTFLIPSAKRKKSNQPRNKYLDALLNKITDYTCNLRMEDDEDYHFKRSNIIIPLCDAFIGARDLLGFLRHWKEQLTICEQSRKTAATFIRSIWEDEIIIQCIANSIELALTSRQIDQVLSAAANDLAHLTFDVLSDQPNLLASLVVLDAIFAGLTREETLNEVDRTAKSIFCLLEVTLSNDANCLQKYRWRIWRIETEIIDGWLSLDKTVELEGNAGSSLVSKASRLLESPSSENTEGVEPDYSEALYAFRFLLSLARFNKAWPAPFEVTSQQIVAQAIENILTIKEFFTRQLREDHFGLLKPLDTFPVFNRVASTVKSVDSYYIGCMVQLLQSPVALDCLNDEQINRLYEQLYWGALNIRRMSSQPISSQTIDSNWLWEDLLRSIVFIDNSRAAKILRNFQAVQYQKILGSVDPNYWNINSVQYAIAFESLQKAPAHRFERDCRVDIANCVLRVLLYQRINSPAKATEHLDLLAKLIEAPAQAMNILSNVHIGLERNFLVEKSRNVPVLVFLADRLIEKQKSLDDFDCVAALRRLAKSVMRYLFSNISQQTSVHYLEELYAWLAGRPTLESKDSENRRSRSVVMEAALDAYLRHRTEVLDPLRQEMGTLNVVRQHFLNSLLKPFYRLDYGRLQEPPARHEVGVGLECLASFTDLLIMNPDLPNFYSTLVAIPEYVRLHKNRDETDMGDYCSVDYLQTRVSRMEYKLGVWDQHLHPSFLGTARKLRNMQSAREKDNLLRHFREAVTMLGPQSKEELLKALIGTDQDGGNLEDSSILLLRTALDDLKDPAQLTEQMGALLPRVFFTISQRISPSLDPRECTLLMQCLSILMQKHSRMVSQWDIENVLAKITSTSLGLNTKVKGSSSIFLGLCKLFSTILAVHRAKLGGRYHLILQALQGLLQCLFIPYKGNGAAKGEATVLGEVHAAAFSKLLTTICEPSVSAVSGSKRISRLELNDETKKAKSIAGRHLHYFIMEYCSLQLKGRLLPEVKAKLAPGLYSVLKVISEEVMKTMNAAMDSSSRSVFKALYGEFKRACR